MNEKKIIISDNQVTEIVRDYVDNMSITDISRKYSYNRKKIRSVLINEGVYRGSGNYGKKYNWTNSDILHIIYLYDDCRMPAHKIGDIYGCRDTTILNILIKNGINTSRKRDNHNWTKYSVDESYFRDIDNQDKAYWYGFLLADGHTTKDGKLKLALQSSDKEHIARFLISLESNHPIHKITQQDAYETTVSSSILVGDLVSKGFNNQKSQWFDVEKIVSHVPESLMHHFIRGYFDGDGCVGIYKQTHGNGYIYHVSIVGIKEMMECINNLFDNKFSINKDDRTTGTYQLVMRNKDNVFCFYEYVYKEANIFLNRKQEIFDRMIRQQQEDLQRL